MLSNMQQSFIKLANPIFAIKSILKHRDLIKQIVKRNVQLRYRGSVLGLIWMVSTPILMIMVYTFVFSVVFKARWGTGTGAEESKIAFALILFCGLAVYNIFVESINTATSVIISNPNLVKKVVFPLEILPLTSLLTSLFFGIVWFVILIISICVLMQKICFTAICLPFVLFPLILFSCGVSWFVSSLATFLRDLPHAITLAMQVLMFLTPIFYSMDMIPEPYKTILKLNPLTYVIENARKVMIYNQWPDWYVLGISMIVAVVVFQLGYMWFMKTKKGFADVL